MYNEIINIRIDERLIHGQIAAAWVGALKATRLMVIDRAASESEIQKLALKMACPQGVKLSILTPEKAVNNFKEGKYAADRVFIVVKHPNTVKELLTLGFEMDTVNVGNMSGRPDTRQIKKAVNVTPAEEELFKELANSIKFVAQLVPGESTQDFIKLL